MGLEGFAKCLKCLVFTFNFIFFLGGIGLMAVGIYVQLKVGGYAGIQDIKYITGAIIIIAVGAFIAIVSFFGCCGAYKEHRCLLATFFALLFLILAVEITGTALGYVYRNQINDQLGEDMNKTLLLYGQTGKDDITTAYDAVQKLEKCCGVNGYKDWQRTWFSNGSHTIVPDSCCKTIEKGCGKGFTLIEINTEGCYSIVETLLKSNLLIIGGIGIGVAVIQILAMIFSIVLVCKIGKQGEYA